MTDKERNIELEEDLKLIQRYKSNEDKDALTSFFKKYMGLIFGVAMKYLKDEENSKDAVMDVYEKISKKLITHQVKNPKSWLYSVTKNHCYEILRRKSRFVERESEAHLMYSEDVFRQDYDEDKEVKLTVLEDCIDTLQDDQQSCIRLFYLEKNTYNDICSKLNITWNRARSLIQNGRRNLKKCMEEKYESITGK